MHRSIVRNVMWMLVTSLIACGSKEPRTASVNNSEPSARSTLCDHLHPGPTDMPGIVNAKEQCGRYRDEFLPQVAAQAVACMESAGWDICQFSPCTERALMTQRSLMDERCTQVQQVCPHMTELCASHIGGMNVSGRDRFATCLQEHCGLGVRFCLWDSMVTACD